MQYKFKRLSIFLWFFYLLTSNLNFSCENTENRFTDYLLFKPKNYNSAKEYPLLFMLHGHGGDYKQWSEIADLDHYANKYNFIIVCPDGDSDSWYVDSPIDSAVKFESYFFNNLVPEIFESYNIDKQNIFITGLSMGGYGAINLFLNHPDFFKSAGSTSGILDLLPFPNNWGIKNVLGEQETRRDNWIKHSAIYNLDKIKSLNKKFIVDCGTEDFAYDVNRRFRDSCSIKGIQLNFIQTSGDHSYYYWNNSIVRHLEFFEELVKNK
jgi:S-formylglutathione hydrolase FrmB